MYLKVQNCSENRQQCDAYAQNIIKPTLLLAIYVSCVIQLKILVLGNSGNNVILKWFEVN